MTKLMQWLCFLGVTFMVWCSLLSDILPFTLSQSTREVVFLVRGVTVVHNVYMWLERTFKFLPTWHYAAVKISMGLFPVYMVIAFGCYSLAVIGYRVLTFNDCEEAAESLRKEIQEARKDLTRKGYKFE